MKSKKAEERLKALRAAEAAYLKDASWVEERSGCWTAPLHQYSYSPSLHVSWLGIKYRAISIGEAVLYQKSWDLSDIRNSVVVDDEVYRSGKRVQV